ncbi:MAG: 1,4-dihydroxy-2-naphthoate polyprenyltransferase [bacterium]|nr:1,4-dihydroxy-2-naphthoate polyprenyltransferase [bacterium]
MSASTSDSGPPSALEVWGLAIRPRTLGASLVPVLVGCAVAWAEAGFSSAVAFVCGLAALLLQIGTNLANDAIDFSRGVDTEARIGPTRVTQAGLLSHRQVTVGAAISFALAVACGTYLVSIGGWPIFWIGLASVVAAVAYSGGPFPLSTHGLGEVAAFVFFGVIAVTGTSFLHTGSLSGLALRASVPVGLLVTCIMLVNNLRDIESDSPVGKRTLAVRLGAARTRVLYALLIGMAFSAPLVLVLPVQGSIPPAAAWLSLPLGIQLIRHVRDARTGPEFNLLLAHTARLHSVFGLLWALGIAF